jgi:hypothetical protein
MTIWIELHSPGALPTRRELVFSRTAVGTGSEATFRVPASTGLAPTHFWVDSTPMGVKVTVQDELPTGLYFEGREFRTITVPWGAEVFVGSTRVAFLMGRSSVTSSGTRLLLAAAVFVGLLGIGMYKSQGFWSVSEPSLEAPALQATARVLCADAIAADAAHTAIETEREALAKQQRLPFDPRDGVEAMDILSKSEACYRVAGRIDEASRIQRAAEKWSEFMNSEYSTTRLRLKFDLEHDRYADAIKRIDELRALLAPRGTGEYTQWLTQTRDALTRRLASSQQ